MMRKTLLVLATIALAVVVAPTALAKSAAETAAAEALTTVKLLAFNDFHGHLEANTPGTIQTGAAFRARRRARRRQSRSRPAAPSTSPRT